MKKKVLGAAAGTLLLLAAAFTFSTEPVQAGPSERAVTCQEAADGSYNECMKFGLGNSTCRQVRAQALASCMRSR